MLRRILDGGLVPERPPSAARSAPHCGRRESSDWTVRGGRWFLQAPLIQEGRGHPCKLDFLCVGGEVQGGIGGLLCCHHYNFLLKTSGFFFPFQKTDRFQKTAGSACSGIPCTGPTPTHGHERLTHVLTATMRKSMSFANPLPPGSQNKLSRLSVLSFAV